MNEIVITPEMMITNYKPFCNLYCGKRGQIDEGLFPRRYPLCAFCIRNGKLLRRFKSRKTKLPQFVLRNYERDYYFPLFG